MTTSLCVFSLFGPFLQPCLPRSSWPFFPLSLRVSSAIRVSLHLIFIHICWLLMWCDGMWWDLMRHFRSATWWLHLPLITGCPILQAWNASCQVLLRLPPPSTGVWLSNHRLTSCLSSCHLRNLVTTCAQSHLFSLSLSLSPALHLSVNEPTSSLCKCGGDYASDVHEGPWWSHQSLAPGV